MKKPSRPPVVRLRQVCVSYPAVVACDHVDLDLFEGEILGLAGKNGAGKSTLIKVLAGVTTPDSGEVQIDGHKVAMASARDATRLGIAVVHQDIREIPSLTVAENISLGIGFPKRGHVLINRTALEDRAAQQLRRLGAADLSPKALVGDLTVVQQRLVTIARALSQNPRVIVLDEPTAALTDTEVSRLHDVMRQLRADGVCVVFVTHRLDELSSLSDRVVVLRNGRVAGEVATERLSRTELISLMTGSSDSAIVSRTPDAGLSRHDKPVLELQDLESLPRVRDVSLDIYAGEILGLAGLTGSGRTELFHLLYGLAKPTRGDIRLDGKSTRFRSPRRALAAEIAFLPEDRRVAGLLSGHGVLQNTTIASLKQHRAWGKVPVPDGRRERRTTAALSTKLGLRRTLPNEPVSTLSGGNQQKVVLARALARGARIFLFDEPTHGVDVEAKEEIYREMERLAHSGAAVVFVSSDFIELVGVCQRVVVMRDGSTVVALRGNAVTEQALTEQAYSSAKG